MHVGIVAQRGNARAADLAADVADRLQTSEAVVRVDPETATVLDIEGCEVGSMDDCDLVVSIGGDGTFLFAARGAGSTPVLGVNLGEVGFLNAVPPGEAIETIEQEVQRFRERGTIRHREVPRVVISGAGTEALSPALNEITIQGHQRGHVDGLSLEIRVDGALYSTSRGDGVLVSTPTGSTAYNLSEGGPLMHPTVNAVVVTDMCGAGSMPPLVVPLDAAVSIRVEDAAEAVVSSDGSEHQTIDLPAELTIRTADQPAKVAGPVSDFFQALNKLE